MTLKQKNDFENIVKICERAEELGIDRCDRLSHIMDIEGTHRVCELSLGNWLKADNYDFTHDFLGIYLNYNRETKKLDNCFLPRFARC